MINRTIIVALILAGILAGCTTTPKFIEFSNNMKQDYPDQRYLTAIGSSLSLSEAQERAQGNLAKVFSSRIEDDSVISQQHTNIAGQQTKSEYLSRSVLVTAHLDIEGIEIAETFYDEQERLYYALAVLNLRQAESRWLDELREINNQIATIEVKLSDDLLPYQTVYQLGKLHQAIVNHNLLINRIQIVNPQTNRRHKRDDSERRLKQATQQMSFAIISNQTEIEELATQILISEGMQQRDKGQANLIIGIRAIELPETSLDNWFIYRNRLELQAEYQDQAPHKHEWRLQASSIDQHEASRRMEQTIAKTLQEEFFSAIIDSLNQGE